MRVHKQTASELASAAGRLYRVDEKSAAHPTHCPLCSVEQAALTAYPLAILWKN
jgi:hypothetical protein